MNDVWIKAEPIVTDDAIMVPLQPYYPEGTMTTYKTVITKELFIEAYKKWILEEKND